MSSVFGDQSWRAALPADIGFRERCLRIVDHYRAQLHDVAGAQYTFPFEMKTALRRPGDVGYFLIFASRHRRGLEKMKEAMRAIDQTGRYMFSNAWAGQGVLLREDHLSEFCKLMHVRFGDRQARYDELNDFALNETPFLNPKKMLSLLEDQGRIRVEASDPTRRRRQFPEEKIRYIEFLKES